MNSLIQNKIGAVFVPVSDMERAIAWYTRLLSSEKKETSHEGKIYDIPLQDGVTLILDGHRAVTNSSQPLFFLWTDDIAAARNLILSLGVPIVREVEHIGSVSTLTIQDPDNNMLTICQRNG